MPYKRPSIWSVGSSGSNTSASTSGSSSALTPSPLAAAIACSDIAEADDEDERPPIITIGDEEIDENPFDPSLPDEIYYEMMQQAASSNRGSPPPTPSRLPERFVRLLSAQKVHRNVPPPASIPSPPSTSTSWRSKFRLRREGSAGEHSPDPDTLEHGPSGPVREQSSVVRCTKRPRRSLHLIPLDVAQSREAIVRHPEGFEIAEAKRAKAAR